MLESPSVLNFTLCCLYVHCSCQFIRFSSLWYKNKSDLMVLMFRFVSNCLREVLKQLDCHFGGCSLWFCWILLLQIQTSFSQLQFLYWWRVFSHQPPNSIWILEICPMSSVISWQIHGDVVVICQAVNLSPFISLTSCFNVTPFYLSVPVSLSVSLSLHAYISQQLSFTVEKNLFSKETSNHSVEDKGGWNVTSWWRGAFSDVGM